MSRGSEAARHSGPGYRDATVADITVTSTGGRPDEAAFRVEVRDGATTTRHEVTVPGELVASLGWDRGGEELVRESFEFLVAREPATSILRRFSLDVIGGYFPEYSSEIRRRRRDRGG